jgi:uncharacterized protein (DUF1330 family)
MALGLAAMLLTPLLAATVPTPFRTLRVPAHAALESPTGEAIMSAYVILDISVTDSVRYEEYKRLAPPAIAAFGGKYLARGGKVEVLEGGWAPGRIVVLEFPAAEQAKAWLESPEYRAARALRHGAASTRAIVVQGI